LWTYLLFSMLVSCKTAAESKPAHVRKLLSRVESGTGGKALARLFRLGDGYAEQFVAALSDPDEQVREGAQRLIRYLGSPGGIAGLRESYRRGNGLITSVIPVPLDDWDYEQISKYITCSDCRASEPFMPDYVYALILDGSPRAHDALTKVQSRFPGWIPSIPPAETLILRNSKPEQELLAHSFFLTNEDKMAATVRTLSLTHDRKKALLEIHVNHGALEEKWFHVVLVRDASAWRFLSVSFVGES
jgi:hypothetical protein